MFDSSTHQLRSLQRPAKMRTVFTLLAFALFSLSALAAPLQVRETACNGSPKLCDRKYSNVTFIGTHNSAFVGPLPTQNQERSLEDQLKGGIRFIQSQVHKVEALKFIKLPPRMCHTNCALEDGGSVEDYLKKVKKFLDENPNEVVTMVWGNADRLPPKTFGDIFKKVDIEKYAFKPKTSPNPMPMEEWPTLGEMIKNNQRLVTFLGKLDTPMEDQSVLMPFKDYGANEKDVPYLLDQFNYYFETPFNTVDPDFKQCRIDRKNKVSEDGKASMFLVNHYLDTEILDMDILVPDRKNTARTNAAEGPGSIGAQAELCASEHGRWPNVVLINFFGKGDPLKAQNIMNGI